MNLCSLLLEAWVSKLKMNVFGFWLSNDHLLHISHIFPFVFVSILFFILNRSSLCRALASSMYSETATRDISRFHLPSSRHILQLVHRFSWQLNPDVLPLLFLQISPLSDFFPYFPVHDHMTCITPVLKVMQASYMMFQFFLFVLIVSSNFMSLLNLISKFSSA